MPELLHPGVYVQEVSSGVRPIEGVSTSTAAFIGIADKGPVPQILSSGQRRIQPVMVTSFNDYVRQFGGFRQDSFLTYAVRSFYDNGGRRLYVVRVVRTDAEPAQIGPLQIAAAAPGTWGSLLRGAISDATDGISDHFNLTVSAPGQNGLVELAKVENLTAGPGGNAQATVNADPNASKYITMTAQPATRPGNASDLMPVGGKNDPSATPAQVTTTGNNPIIVEALLPGAWANNNLSITISQATNGQASDFNLEVKLSGNLVETFTDLSFDSTSPKYAMTVINAPLANAGSRYIKVLTNPPLQARPDDAANQPLTGGTDGPSSVNAAGILLPAAAANEGAWGNNIWVSVQDSADGDSNHFNLLVGYGATQDEANANIVETFSSVTFRSAKNTDPIPENDVAAQVNGRSEYIRITSPATALPLFSPLIRLNGGSDGIAPDIDLLGDESNGTGLYALDKITDVNLIAIPGAGDAKTISAGMGYCKNKRQLQDCFFIGDVGLIADVRTARTVGTQPSVVRVNDARTFALNGDANSALDKAPGDFGAIYYPWVLAADPIGVGRNPRILLPPSGFMAGIYARTDNSRGVFKAPAGTDAGVSGALATATMVGDLEQDTLNPVGVNVIRTVPGSGIVVWGTRTIGSNAEWRYIPVRRMAIFLRVSIYYGIQWAVFEPNDEPLWASLRLNIRSFMLTQFRAGAFQGRTPDEAFFVKCDSTTTTQQDIDLGIVNILVGFAPLKPAEFIVLKLSQKVNQPAA